MLSDIVNKIRAQRDHEPTVISLGQTWVDTLMRVPEMPQAGRFVEASTVSRSIGGSFQVLEAAERMGARTELASMMGTGPWADCIAHALRQAHIVYVCVDFLNLGQNYRLFSEFKAVNAVVALRNRKE